MPWRIWLVAALALVAACGDDDDAFLAASTSSSRATTREATIPIATTTSTTLPVSTTTVPAPDTAVVTTAAVPTTNAAGCSEAPDFDLERPLRDQFVEYLVACGFTYAESACLFDHIDFEDPAVLAGEADSMVPAFQECRIDLDRMAEIGGA